MAGKFATPLRGKLAALLFFEPSSRTFSSHAAAVKRLGGQTVEYQQPNTTSSTVKGETLEDTVNVFEHYVDLIIIRHPVMGTALRAAEAAITKPIINAGDGSGEHPTQALLDMFTFYEQYKRLDGLTGLMTGDLLYGRTVHSLVKGLSLFQNNTIFLLSPKNLRFPKELLVHVRRRGMKLVEIEHEKDIPENCHFWYWTRVQKERFSDLSEYERVKHRFVLTSRLIKERADKKTLLLHPLPRVGEIEPTVDSDPRALYLRDEVANGLYVRMALLTLILIKNTQSYW